MKNECIAAVERAAGRKLTKGEIDGIDSRMRTSMRDFSIQRPDEFMAMTPAERVTEAARMAKERMMEDVVKAHESEVRNATIRAGLDDFRNSFAAGKAGRLLAATQRFFFDAGSRAGDTSVEMNRKAIMGDFMRHLADVQKVDAGKFFGMMQDITKRDAIIKELHGEPSGDADAASVAKAFKATNDMAAKRADRAGIGFHELENWSMPRYADWVKVARSKEDWVSNHLEWVDRRAYVNADGTRMNDEQLKSFLGKVWETQSTNGANKRAESENGVGSGLGTSRNNPRQVHYKDAASYTQAMEKYGRATNVYSLFMQHFNGLSKDIAIAEVLGRDHEKNFKYLVEQSFVDDLRAAKTDKERVALEAMRQKAYRMYDVLSKGEGVGNQLWAQRMAGVRSVISSTMLGGLFGAVPDFAMVSLTAKLNGLPQLKAMGQALKGIVSKSDGEMLERVGLVVEGMQSAAYRFGSEELGTGVPAMLNQAVHKLSFLNALDRGMRSGIGLSMMDLFGKLTRTKSLADLHGSDHEFLVNTKGVTDLHWNVWRAADVDTGPNGNRTLLTPDAIYAIPDEKMRPLVQEQIAARSEIYKKELDRLNAKVGDPRYAEYAQKFQDKFGKIEGEEIERAKSDAVTKLLAATHSELQAGARGASGSSVMEKVNMGLDRAQAGTAMGEIYRLALLMKQTPLGIAYNHLFRRPAALDGWQSQWMYRAQFVAYSTLLGALAIQLKAMASGEDPTKMDSMKFWGKAITAGGGFGLYGDLLFADGGHTTNGIAGVLGGPGISAVEDAFRLYQGAKKDFEENGQYKYGSKFLEFGRKYATPMANIWYLKGAFNHLIYHNMQEMLDPGWSARLQARMQQKNQTSYWWSPGPHGPDRAPDLTKAVP